MTKLTLNTKLLEVLKNIKDQQGVFIEQDKQGLIGNHRIAFSEWFETLDAEMLESVGLACTPDCRFQLEFLEIKSEWLEAKNDEELKNHYIIIHEKYFL